MSRLRILPVGPLGRVSTNHTCRGVLVPGDLRLHVLAQLIDGGGGTPLEDDDGGHLLPEERIRQADHRGLGDRGMLV